MNYPSLFSSAPISLAQLIHHILFSLENSELFFFDYKFMLISFVIRGELHYSGRRSVWYEHARHHWCAIHSVDFKRKRSLRHFFSLSRFYSRWPHKWRFFYLELSIESVHCYKEIRKRTKTFLHFIYNDFATFYFSFRRRLHISVASYTHRHQTIIFLMDRGVLKRERRNIYKKII